MNEPFSYSSLSRQAKPNIRPDRPRPLVAEIAAFFLASTPMAMSATAVQQHLDVGAVKAETVLVIADVAHDLAGDLGEGLAFTIVCLPYLRI